MKRSIYFFLTGLILTGLSACRSYNYYTAAINKTNLSAYHTFAWMPGVSTDQNSDKNGNQNSDKHGNKDKKNDKTSDNKMNVELADSKIRSEATKALISKGLKETKDNPDLIVGYTAKVGIGVRTNYYYGGWGWGGYGWGGYGGYGWGGYGYGWRGGWGYGGWGGYGWGGYGWGYPAYAEREHYNEGTLIIDLIDTHTHKIVWRGFGVTEYKDPQRTLEDLPIVVDGVLAQLQLPLTPQNSKDSKNPKAEKKSYYY
ncbi:MAG TPA: DUF4136 domain-containing protein [Mucilaginibacter sp.]|jgi:hypothetical protein